MIVVPYAVRCWTCFRRSTSSGGEIVHAAPPGRRGFERGTLAARCPRPERRTAPDDLPSWPWPQGGLLFIEIGDGIGGRSNPPYRRRRTIPADHVRTSFTDIMRFSGSSFAALVLVRVPSACRAPGATASR